MEYIVDVTFSYSGYLRVKADNKEDAERIAQNAWIEEFNISEGSLERKVVDIREDEQC